MTKITYSTSDIARFLGIKKDNVSYYIRAGYLQATKVPYKAKGRFLIEKEDFLRFKKDYFIPEQKNKLKGPKTFTHKQLTILEELLPDLKNDSLCFSEFMRKNEQKIYLLPFPKPLIRYKRNRCIHIAKSLGKKIKEIATLFNLSEIAVRTILKEEEELELI